MQIRLLLITLIFGTGLVAQVKILPPIIEKLASVKQPVTCFALNNSHLLAIPDLPENFLNAPQNIIKTKEGVFLQMDGTGRLYRLIKTQNGYAWSRMDSTYFSGYNFGALTFALDSTFYSFGGNGYWMINGILRYFNPHSKEWNQNPTSDPIYFSKKMNKGNDHFYFLDTSTSMLYLQGINFSHQAIADPFQHAPNKNKLFRLNILNGVFETIGQLPENTAYHFLGITPWGAFANNNVVIDVKNNVVYQLSKTKIDEVTSVKEKSTSSNDFSISFFVDSLLYIGNYVDKMDSIKITFKDLIKLEKKFYTPIASASSKSNINWKNLLIIGLISIILLLVFLLVGKKNKWSLLDSINSGADTKNKLEVEIENQVSFRSSKIIELLEQRERELLSFIFKQSSEEKLTSIDEINKAIGATHRSPEIQKRLRSDLIIAINEKLSIITKSKNAVIEKQRSEFDKRSFEYFIKPEFMELVGKIIE